MIKHRAFQTLALPSAAFLAGASLIALATAAPVERGVGHPPSPLPARACPAGFTEGNVTGSPPNGPNSGYSCTKTVMCLPANGATLGAGGVVNQVSGGATFILNCRYSTIQ